MKGSGGADKARLHIKLEDSAIGYLVKKWNELEINVEGDAVTAEVVGGEASDPPSQNACYSQCLNFP